MAFYIKSCNFDEVLLPIEEASVLGEESFFYAATSWNTTVVKIPKPYAQQLT